MTRTAQINNCISLFSWRKCSAALDPQPLAYGPKDCRNSLTLKGSTIQGSISWMWKNVIHEWEIPERTDQWVEGPRWKEVWAKHTWPQTQPRTNWNGLACNASRILQTVYFACEKSQTDGTKSNNWCNGYVGSFQNFVSQNYHMGCCKFWIFLRLQWIQELLTAWLHTKLEKTPKQLTQEMNSTEGCVYDWRALQTTALRPSRFLRLQLPPIPQNPHDSCALADLTMGERHLLINRRVLSI